MTFVATAASSPAFAAAQAGAASEEHAVYLHPGQLYASRRPAAVTTILGSCVAVCLWDERLRIGGVNHFLLPNHAGDEVGTLRFGNLAVRRLIEELAGLGSKRCDFHAKVFGGASVLGKATGATHLGARNATLARKLLAEAGIAVVAEDVGGERGRKLRYHTESGDAWVRALWRTEA